MIRSRSWSATCSYALRTRRTGTIFPFLSATERQRTNGCHRTKDAADVFCRSTQAVLGASDEEMSRQGFLSGLRRVVGEAAPHEGRVDERAGARPLRVVDPGDDDAGARQ